MSKENAEKLCGYYESMRIEDTLDWLINNEQIYRGKTQRPITSNLMYIKKIVKVFETIRNNPCDLIELAKWMNFITKTELNIWDVYYICKYDKFYTKEEFSLLVDIFFANILYEEKEIDGTK